MKVVVTGAGGQVGTELAGCAPSAHAVTLLNSRDCDITNAEAVAAMLRRERPDVVINAAAYTAVDRAESEPGMAERVNALGPANLATGGGHRVLHISTDFVFGGEGGRAWLPSDRPNPLSVYGRTKLAGETPVLARGPAGLVLRTSWVYAVAGNNFVRTMLRLMRERRDIGVVSDQIGAPTWAQGLARALWKIVDLPQLHGIHHWRDAGVASWYDFAVAIAEEGERRGLLPHAVSVRPIGTHEYPTPARRPSFSLLDCTETWQALGAPPHWRAHLNRVLDSVKEGHG